MSHTHKPVQKYEGKIYIGLINYLLLSVVYSKQQRSQQDPSTWLKDGVWSILHEYRMYQHPRYQQWWRYSGSLQDQRKLYEWNAPQDDPQRGQYLEPQKRNIRITLLIMHRIERKTSQLNPIKEWIFLTKADYPPRTLPNLRLS